MDDDETKAAPTESAESDDADDADDRDDKDGNNDYEATRDSDDEDDGSKVTTTDPWLVLHPPPFLHPLILVAGAG